MANLNFFHLLIWYSMTEAQHQIYSAVRIYVEMLINISKLKTSVKRRNLEDLQDSLRGPSAPHDEEGIVSVVRLKKDEGETTEEAIVKESKILVADLINERMRKGIEFGQLELLRTAITAAAEGTEGGIVQLVDEVLLSQAQSFLAERTLRAAVKWYPLNELRLAIAAAEGEEQAVDELVLVEARTKLAKLAGEELKAAIRQRQLEPLRDTMVTAKEEGLADATVVEEAQALLLKLEKAPPGAKPAPAGTHGTDELIRPTHIDEAAVFSRCASCASKSTTAVNDYKYFGGERSGTHLPPLATHCLVPISYYSLHTTTHHQGRINRGGTVWTIRL